MVGFIALIGCGGTLAWTNPSMQAYRLYAADQLVELATEKLCEQQGLPMVLRLWIQNCPELIAAQRPAFASSVEQFSERLNLGLFSIYTTKVGGQNVLPTLRLPHYQVTTLAVAGHFLPLSTRTDSGRLE